MATQKDAIQLALNIIEENEKSAARSYGNALGSGDQNAVASYAASALALGQVRREVAALLKEEEGKIEPVKK